MAFKRDEESCCQRLQAMLEKFGLNVSFAEGDDPPDAEFTVNGTRWAVEITELHQYIDSASGELPFAAVFASARGLIAQIQREVATDVVLGYQAYAQGPYSKEEAERIVREAVEYIRSAPTGAIELGNEGKFRLVPVTRPLKIGLSSGLAPNATGADGSSQNTDIAANIRFTVDRILNEKCPKLGALDGYEKKAILIDSRYIFADAEEVIPVIMEQDIQARGLDYILLLHDGECELIADPGGDFGPFLAM